MKEKMTIKEVAKFLRISESDLNEIISMDELKSDGDYILAVDLINFIESNMGD